MQPSLVFLPLKYSLTGCFTQLDFLYLLFCRFMCTCLSLTSVADNHLHRTEVKEKQVIVNTFSTHTYVCLLWQTVSS